MRDAFALARHAFRGLLRAGASRMAARGGFTLSELLVTTIILLLTTGVAAESFPVIRNVYVNAIDAANAQVMMNNATILLRNELCLAAYVNREETEDGDGRSFVSIIYTDVRTGYRNRIISQKIDEDGDSEFRTIMLAEYADFADYGGTPPAPRPLLFVESQDSAAAASAQSGEPDSGMILSFDDINCNNKKDIYKITGLHVWKIVYVDGAKSVKEIVSLPSYNIRTANPVPAAG